MMEMREKKSCPIDKTLEYIGKKWNLLIIRDLFLGKKKFNEFLESNPQLSNKVLSQKLKELETHSLIEKRIISKTPLLAEYYLTDRGKALNKVLFEIAMFGVENISQELTLRTCSKESIEHLKKSLNL